MKKTSNVWSTQNLVLTAALTALVVLLQFLGASIRFGPFSITLTLIPIVIGAAMCGVGAGTWLGFVFGVVVLLSGDAGPFMAVNPVGAVLTVLAKGTLCGFVAGVVYRALCRWNFYVAVVAAALVCPLVNTGIFLLGCLLFFMELIASWTAAANLGTDVVRYMIFGLVGANFLVETATNMVLSPVLVRLLKIGHKNK